MVINPVLNLNAAINKNHNGPNFLPMSEEHYLNIPLYYSVIFEAEK